MRARRVDSLWEVTEGEKFWTVSDDGLIMNGDLREVKPSSRIGQKILAAVEARRAREDA